MRRAPSTTGSSRPAAVSAESSMMMWKVKSGEAWSASKSKGAPNCTSLYALGEDVPCTPHRALSVVMALAGRSPSGLFTVNVSDTAVPEGEFSLKVKAGLVGKTVTGASL